MKNRLVSIGLTAVFLGLFIYYFINNIEDFKVLLNIDPLGLILVGIIQFITIIVNAFFILVIVKIFSVNISIMESIKLAGITSIGNYFIPFRGGAGVRAFYLKQKHKLPYSKFLSTLAGNYIIVFFISSLLALVGLTILRIQGEDVSNILFFVFTSMFLILLAIMIFKIPTFLNHFSSRYKLLDRIIKRAESVLEGWNEIIRHRKLLVELSFLTLINMSLNIILVYLQFWLIEVPIGIFQILVFASVSTLSLFISITPGSLGIKESLLILFQDTLQLGTDDILITSIIDRGVYFFVMLFLLIVAKILNVKIWPSSNGKK